MKTICSVFLLLSMLVLPFNILEAHPGRTDANGGHVCRTNCEKWGLQYGEYHYHNGGKSSSSNGSNAKTPPQGKNEPAQPAVQKKAIVVVSQANVYKLPDENTDIVTTLWYGYEINDKGTNPDFASIEQGFVSKKLITQYTVLSPKTVSIHVDQGYFFPIPSADSQSRGYAAKDAIVHVAGESGDWYYGSTTDVNGKVLVGFVSKKVAF